MNLGQRFPQVSCAVLAMAAVLAVPALIIRHAVAEPGEQHLLLLIGGIAVPLCALMGAGALYRMLRRPPVAETEVAVRLQAEEQERQAEVRYRHTVDNAIEGIYRTSPDGRCELVNPAMARILGFDSPDALAQVMIGQNEGFYVDTGRRAELLRRLEADDQVIGFESEIYRHDGSVIWVSENVRVVRDESGRLVALEGSLIDISDQKHAARELLLSELRYRELADFLPQPVFELDADGLPTYVNRAAVSWYGPNIETMMGGGKVLLGLVIPKQRRQAYEAFQRALAGERISGLELTAVRGDGEQVPVLVFASPVHRDGVPAGVRILAVDISVQKRVEAALREAEQRQAAVLRSLPVAVYTSNVPSDFDASWISDSVQRVTGFPADRFLTEPEFWSSRIHAEDRLRVTREYRRGAEQGEAAVEYRWRVADGSFRWFFDSALCTGRSDNGAVEMTGIIRDITEEKNAREALRRSERYYRGLFDGAHDAILVFDPETERILDVNTAACALYRRPRAELVGLSLASISKDISRGKRQIQATLESGSQLHSFETVQLRRDGTEVVLEVNASVVEYDGRPAILSVNRDVTERRTLEERLRQSQKLEAVGRLAGGIAHDFNNLLTVITANSELLLMILGDSHPQRARIEQILHAGKRGADLTRQLLAFSRQQPVRPKLIDLGQELPTICKLLERLLGDHIVLELELSEKPLLITIDPTQLEQVVLNLAVNARDAMPTGGRLTIRGTPREIAAANGLELAAGSYVELEVEDEGIGMDRRTQEQIFEPFFTTKGIGTGTGLGLATVYGIVHQAGGLVTVRSQPGEGSCFSLLLPASCGTAVLETDAVQRIPELRARVLVVEDDALVRNGLVAMLEQLGATVLEASGPDEARQVVASEQIDVVLSDVVMPGGSGDALARELRDLRPGLDVVLMSGHSSEMLSRHGVDTTSFVLLQKPFPIETLAESLRAALG